jgi:hypothetical protein
MTDISKASTAVPKLRLVFVFVSFLIISPTQYVSQQIIYDLMYMLQILLYILIQITQRYKCLVGHSDFMDGVKAKKNYYDDETLEKMKKHFNIDNDDDLLRYIASHGLKDYKFEIEEQ